MNYKEYPRIYKVEILSNNGAVYFVLYSIDDDSEENDIYKNNQGPNYLFEFFVAHPDYSGFAPFLKDIKNFNFEHWSSLPFVERIKDGESGAEYGGIIMNNPRKNPIVAVWDESKPDSLDILEASAADWIKP